MKILSERETYKDGAKWHSVPWECPAHGESMLFGTKNGLMCGLCSQLKFLHDHIEAQASQIDSLTKLLDLKSSPQRFK